MTEGTISRTQTQTIQVIRTSAWYVLRATTSKRIKSVTNKNKIFGMTGCPQDQLWSDVMLHEISSSSLFTFKLLQPCNQYRGASDESISISVFMFALVKHCIQTLLEAKLFSTHFRQYSGVGSTNPLSACWRSHLTDFFFFANLLNYNIVLSQRLFLHGTKSRRSILKWFPIHTR